MRDSREPRAFFIVLFLCAAALAVHDYPLVPIRMASHFDASGSANAWMSKPLFFEFYAAAIALAFVVEFLVPKLLAGSSTSRINLPNKEYWLAPKRRAESIAYLQRLFAWYGCAFLLLEVSAMEMAIRANMSDQPQLPLARGLILVGGFLVFNVIWMVRMLRRFAKTGTD